jgi:AcrR family transcriptional regulator
MAVKDRKAEIVNQAIAYMEENGIGDLSLRGLAAALGTSHRMLIHHFGSKEGLWIAIVKAVEERQREILIELVPDPDKPVGESLRDWWKHISDPSLWPNARLFYELYGRALQSDSLRHPFLDGIVEDWLVPATEINVAYGLPRDLARAHARLGIAAVRGLLLDVLATGDVEGVDASMEAFIDVYEAWLERAARLVTESTGARAASAH